MKLKELENKIIIYFTSEQYYNKLSFIDEILEGVKSWRLFRKRD